VYHFAATFFVGGRRLGSLTAIALRTPRKVVVAAVSTTQQHSTMMAQQKKPNTTTTANT